MSLRPDLLPGLRALGVLSLLTGIVYPVAVTGIAATAFPVRSRGSLITVRDTVRGSLLVGQSFTSPRYLWGRPSAIARPYDARGSAGSNLGPTNPALDSLVRARVASIRAAGDAGDTPVPADLVTASGSGLDPHLSPAAADLQVARIAQARGLDPRVVRQAVDAGTATRTFGLLGEPRVNVLQVNLALDALPATAAPAPTLRPTMTP
ncbi:MAG: potassium-transporting ATPase subunit KdpC [Gemmatimonadaceae bacterium]|nr:potassium-transporting ATPase subunit KdpC [Gemmatimonadaceae bacterium]